MMFRAIFVAVFLQLAKSAFARPGNLQSPPPPGKSGKVWMIEMWLFFRLLTLHEGKIIVNSATQKATCN